MTYFAHHPYCKKCGWHKGGPDSWNGYACKCGESGTPIKRIEDTKESKRETG